MKEEFTTKMHETMWVPEEVDRRHRASSAVIFLHGRKDDASVEEAKKIYRVTTEDLVLAMNKIF